MPWPVAACEMAVRVLRGAASAVSASARPPLVSPRSGPVPVRKLEITFPWPMGDRRQRHTKYYTVVHMHVDTTKMRSLPSNEYPTHQHSLLNRRLLRAPKCKLYAIESSSQQGHTQWKILKSETSHIQEAHQDPWMVADLDLVRITLLDTMNG